VLVTDLFQFVVKMGMVIVLAVFAVRAWAASGPCRRDSVSTGRGGALNFRSRPELRTGCRSSRSGVYIGLNWWATWYPGGGAGRRRLRGPADVLRAR